MKKQFAFFLLITVAEMLLSSCGNLSKMSLTKRHYRSGYYVDFGIKNHNSTVSNVTKQPIKIFHQVLSSTITAKTEKGPIIHIQKEISVKSSASPKIALLKKTKVDDIKTVNYTSSQPKNFNQYNTGKQRVNSESDNEVHARVDIDIPFVVIVLCAIFIPPLGVGLMYGLNDYFWIDLILTLLFFFPGMIFALIVVLM